MEGGSQASLEEQKENNSSANQVLMHLICYSMQSICRYRAEKIIFYRQKTETQKSRIIPSSSKHQEVNKQNSNQIYLFLNFGLFVLVEVVFLALSTFAGNLCDVHFTPIIKQKYKQLPNSQEAERIHESYEIKHTAAPRSLSIFAKFK